MFYPYFNNLIALCMCTCVEFCVLCPTDRGSGRNGLEGGSVPDLDEAVIARGVDQVVRVDQRVNDLLVALQVKVGFLCQFVTSC